MKHERRDRLRRFTVSHEPFVGGERATAARAAARAIVVDHVPSVPPASESGSESDGQGTSAASSVEGVERARVQSPAPSVGRPVIARSGVEDGEKNC